MDIISLAGRNDEQRHAGLSEPPAEDDPSMQDIINSMRNHLLAPSDHSTIELDSDSQSVTAQRANRRKARNNENSEMPGKQISERPLANANDSILRLLTGEHSTDKNQRGLTEEEKALFCTALKIASFNKGVVPTDDDDDVVSISSARLRTPFYDELRKKYPQAFLRKRNSLSSNVSESSSYYGGGDTPRRVSGTPRSSRVRKTPRPGEGELPPIAPNSARSRRGAGKPPVDVSDNEGDTTISGTPRRGAKTGRLQGILKNSRQYSSTLSLQNENTLRTSIDEPVSNLQRSDSNSSLKERLKNHQESWKSLFTEENSIFSKIKRTNSMESLDSEVGPKPALKPKPKLTSKPFQDVQNRIPNQDDGSEQSSSSASQSGQKRPLSDPRSRRRDAQMKRFASPDSHDSAVEIDNASSRSGRSSETNRADNGTPVLNQHSPNSSQTPARGRSPSRPRTPKLKSQSRSSSPMVHSPNGYANDTSPGGSVVHGMSESDLPGFPGHHHGRDSDADSGIIQGLRGHGSVSSNDDDADSTVSKVHPSQKLGHLSQCGIKQKTRRGSDASHVSQKQGPVKANHAIPVSPSDDQQKQPKWPGGESGSRRERGHRPRGKIYGDPGPPPLSRGQRASSADRKRERVTFEDEIMEDDRLSSSQRSNSLLNIPYIAPPPDFAGSNGDLSRIPVYDDYDMDYNSPRGYLTPRRAAEHNMLLDGAYMTGYEVPTPGEMQMMRGMSSGALSPSHQLVAAAMGEENLESSMEHHRASPVVLNSHRDRASRSKPPTYKPKQSPRGSSRPASIHDLPPPPPASTKPCSPSPAAHVDLNSSYSSEVAMFSGLMDDINFESKEKKKSKLPWKKNKGRYTPTKEIEKMQQLNRGLNPGSRAGSWSSLNGDQPQTGHGSKPPTAKKTKPSSQPVPPPRRKTKGKVGKISIEHVDADRMSQCSGEYEPVDSGSGRRRGSHTENTYEEVDLLRPAPKYVDINSNADKADPTDIYSVVHKPPRPKKSSPLNNPAIANTYDSSIEQLEPPPVPKRGYESDLEKHRALSGSQTSLSGRLGSFRDSAKKKFNQLKKSLSLEKLDKVGKDDDGDNISIGSGRFKKSPSLRSFSEALGIRREKKKPEEDSEGPPTHRRPPRPQSLNSSKRNVNTSEAVDSPRNFRSLGKVREFNKDGTQVVELSRPPHGPFGFYIARGNAKYKGAIFVSRLSDGLPESFFMGLLGVGDEIIEINGQVLRELPLEAVYDLMKENNKLVLKTLPYVVRSDC